MNGTEKAVPPAPGPAPLTVALSLVIPAHNEGSRLEDGMSRLHVALAAGAIAAQHCHPVADQRGPEDYKRHLVAELTTRALHRAAARVTLAS